MIPFDQLAAALESYNRRRQPASEPAPPRPGTPASVDAVKPWGEDSPNWEEELAET